MKLVNLLPILFFLFIFVLSVFAESQTHQKYLKNFQENVSSKPTLEINLTNKTYAAGEFIELSITFKNNTNSRIGLFDVEPERSFDIIIKYEEGVIQPLPRLKIFFDSVCILFGHNFKKFDIHIIFEVGYLQPLGYRIFSARSINSS